MPAAAAILGYVAQFLSILPSLIGTGQSVMGLITSTQSAISKMQSENRPPSAEEWAALDAARDAVHAAIQKM